MQVFIDVQDASANAINLDGVIFAQAVTEVSITLSTEQSLADGSSVALLTPTGETLAHALTSASTAILDTNTAECYAYVDGLPLETSRSAFLVIGESTKPLAMFAVEVSRNPIANIAPPTESAPIYPTAEELQTILAEMAQKQTAVNEDYQAVQTLVEGFPETVRQGEEAVNRAASTGASAIVNLVNEKVMEIDEAKQTAVQAVETTATNAETALQGKVDEATESIEESTKAATDAATEAVEAQEGAEAAQAAAEIALNNGCVYQVREVTDAAIALDKTLTAYKHTPTADTAYTFTAPADVAGKIIVFWLWVVQGATAHQLTFDSNITWLSEPALAANTETLLAFMSVDGGMSWTANVQWEREVTA